MAQLTAVSSPVVQRHTPWNQKARACGVWCEIFAPQTAKSQGETPPFVLLHHGMTEAFSGGCSTNILISEIAELCKRVHCVDLGESFQTHIYLQNLASIQPKTSLVKFARSP